MSELFFTPHSSFLERSTLFFSKYEPIYILGIGDNKFSRSHLKPRAERVCLFCNNDNSKTTFISDSHLVSKFIGNTDLFSDFECDVCNKKFGQFESDLAYFLGISRSFLELSGDRKAPSFVTRKLSVKSRSFIGENILIISKEDLNQENSQDDRKAGKLKISYTKPPYIPSNVFKALVKASLSIFSEQEVKTNYALGLDFLNGAYHINGAHIYGYVLPFQYNMPLHIHVFRKKQNSDVIPTHVIGFYFLNYIIYLPLTFHKDDIPNYEKKIEMPFAPPCFVIGSPLLKTDLTSFYKDLSGNTKVTDDTESTTIVINPECIKHAYKYDPNTDQFSNQEYSHVNTKYIIVTKEGTSFTKDQVRQLTEFLKIEANR